MKTRLLQACLITLVTIFSLLLMLFFLRGIEFTVTTGNGGIGVVSGGISDRWNDYMLLFTGAIIVAVVMIRAVMRKKRRA